MAELSLFACLLLLYTLPYFSHTRQKSSQERNLTGTNFDYSDALLILEFFKLNKFTLVSPFIDLKNYSTD